MIISFLAKSLPRKSSGVAHRRQGRVSKIRPGIPNQCLNGLVRNYKRTSNTSFGHFAKNINLNSSCYTSTPCDFTKKNSSATNVSKAKCPNPQECPIHNETLDRCSKGSLASKSSLAKQDFSQCTSITSSKKSKFPSKPNVCEPEPEPEPMSCETEHTQSSCDTKPEPERECDDTPKQSEETPYEETASCEQTNYESFMDVDENDTLHQEAEKLFNNCASSMEDNRETWAALKVNKKLIYYWASISHDIPYQCPWDNFASFYKTKKRSRLSEGKSIQKAIGKWKKMRYNEKLPFIAEALINNVGSELNIFSDDDGESKIRTFFNQSRKEDSRKGG